LKFFATNIFWFWYNVVGFVVTMAVAYGLLFVFKREEYVPAVKPETDSVAPSMLSKSFVLILLTAFVTMILVSLAMPMLLT